MEEEVTSANNLEVAEQEETVESTVAQEEQPETTEQSDVVEATDSPEENSVESKEGETKKPQTDEENSKYRQARIKAEKEAEKKIEAARKEAYEQGLKQGKVNTYIGKQNPYTNKVIKDQYDVEEYLDMFELDSKGEDPIDGYRELQKQKAREEAEKKIKLDEKEFMKTNIGTFRYIFSDRTNYAINDTQYKFEVTLRGNSLYNQKKSSRNNNNLNDLKNKIKWDPTLIPRTKSLFDTMLPPILSRSKEIFSKFGDKIGRPVINIKKDGYINGTKVKSRVYEYNKNVALRYPSEHYPSSKYQNDYGIQNIGSIRHLLDCDNRTMTSFWSTYLRGKKKIKFTAEETKKREKRLRDRSLEKNYPKN